MSILYIRTIGGGGTGPLTVSVNIEGACIRGRRRSMSIVYTNIICVYILAGVASLQVRASQRSIQNAALSRVAWQPKSGHHGDSDLFAGHHARTDVAWWCGSSALENAAATSSPATFSAPLDSIVVANFSIFLSLFYSTQPSRPIPQSHTYTYTYILYIIKVLCFIF